MRVVTWNILSGTVLTPGSNLIEAIKSYNPDVLALQEVDHRQSRSEEVESIEQIAALCGFPYWVFAPSLMGTPGNSPIPANEHMSHLEASDLQTSYGIALLSKIPISRYEILNLKKAPIGLPLLVASPRGQRVIYVQDEPRVAIAAVLEDGTVIVTAHLSFVPPFNSIQLNKIRRWAEQFGEKAIFVGDFNALIFGKAGLKSLNPKKSYPGWNPKLKFDFMLSNSIAGEVLDLEYLGVSDHQPLGMRI